MRLWELTLSERVPVHVGEMHLHKSFEIIKPYILHERSSTLTHLPLVASLNPPLLTSIKKAKQNLTLSWTTITVLRQTVLGVNFVISIGWAPNCIVNSAMKKIAWRLSAAGEPVFALLMVLFFSFDLFIRMLCSQTLRCDWCDELTVTWGRFWFMICTKVLVDGSAVLEGTCGLCQ